MTTIDNPNDWDTLSTSITKDVGINALRQARVTMEESMALASECIIAYRTTVKEQTTRITELESKLAAAEHRIASQKVEILEAEEDVGRIQRANKSMHDRLTAHAEDRIRPRSHSDLDCDAGPGLGKADRMADAFANMITMARAAGATAKSERVHRIATAIINRLDDGHPVIAYHLALNLQEENADGNSDNGATQTVGRPRPKHVEPTRHEFGSFGDWIDSLSDQQRATIKAAKYDND